MYMCTWTQTSVSSTLSILPLPLSPYLLPLTPSTCPLSPLALSLPLTPSACPLSPRPTPSLPAPSHTHMVRIGATRSRLAMTTPTSAIRKVRMRAKLGSPFRPVRRKKLRNEIRLSLAMAWSSLGALCVGGSERGRHIAWSVCYWFLSECVTL